MSAGGSARRKWLQESAFALGAIVLAPGIRLIEFAAAARASESPAASPRVRWGMLIDANRCTPDCDACVHACNEENGLSGGTSATDARWLRKIEIRDRGSGRTTSAPLMCQHCANAPCIDVCPTGASFRRVDGIVLVDRHACIGCRYCMIACPIQARSFVHEAISDQKPQVPRGKGCVEGCTMCVHRLDRGLAPACVVACPREAIVFGDLADAGSEISRRVASLATKRVRDDLRLDGSIHYGGL